jgi:outer membrane lipase/esterase
MLTAASVRSFASTLPARRLRLLSAAIVMGLGLAACGGGTQVSKFTPSKILSFGDELSFLGSQTVQSQTLVGQKYGVNYVYTDQVYYTAASTSPVTDTTLLATVAAETYGAPVTYSSDSSALRFIKAETSTTLATNQRQTRVLWDCATEARLWMQILANGYGLGYSSACPTDRSGAYTYAQIGAKSADVIAQLNAHRADMTSSTLVTVLAGQNDIIEQLAVYRATPGQLAAIKATLKTRGEVLGQAVNALLPTGARFLIVTPPDLGKAPGAGSDGTALTEMTQAFVDGFTGLSGVTNDGTKIGLVKAFDLVKDIHNNPSAYGMNVLERACNTAGLVQADGITPSTSLLDCTYSITTPVRNNLVAGAALYTHLWASDFVLAPGGQARIGSLAYSRATANPF